MRHSPQKGGPAAPDAPFVKATPGAPEVLFGPKHLDHHRAGV